MAKAGQTEWTEARAIFENAAGETLIVRASGEADATPWEFPGGKLQGQESPETALRRLCRDLLGVAVEFVRGQPPFVHNFGTHTVTYRYYHCRVAKGQPQPRGVAELRWIRPGQLREYVFDRPTQQVVDWLLENAG